jgi:tetratricopeptide (TPR) repeat protein
LVFLGELKFSYGDSLNALQIYMQALEYSRHINDRIQYASIMSKLGLWYCLSSDSLLLAVKLNPKNRYALAFELNVKADSLTNESDRITRQGIYDTYEAIFEGQKNYPKAIDVYSKRQIIGDSISSETIIKNVNKIEGMYDAYLEKQIEADKKQKEKDDRNRAKLVMWLIVSFISIFLLLFAINRSINAEMPYHFYRPIVTLGLYIFITSMENILHEQITDIFESYPVLTVLVLVVILGIIAIIHDLIIHSIDIHVEKRRRKHQNFEPYPVDQDAPTNNSRWKSFLHFIELRYKRV